MTFIINLDKFDRRQFVESVASNDDLQEVERNGVARQPSYSEFMTGVFGALYKYDPKQRTEDAVDQSTDWMDKIYNELKQLPEWNTLRERTKLNSEVSALATAGFCDKFMKAVPFASKGAGHGTHEYDSTKLDPSLVRKTARAACKQAVEEADQFIEAMNALGHGTGTGRAQTISPTIKNEMAKRIINNDKIKQIAQLAGRMQRIALQKQKTKTRHGTDELNDITVGADLGRLVPSELMKLSHPLLKLDFGKRFLEKSLISYQLSGHERMGRGPLIICCDESASMQGQKDVWSKAVALALLRIAQKQRRTFAMVHFDAAVTRTDVFGKKADPIAVMDAISHFTCGGTNFEHPLNECIQLMTNEIQYKKADIVFICDGEARISDEFLKLFNKAKKLSQTQVISVLIDCQQDAVCRSFSDKIVHVNRGDDKEALNIMFDV